MKVKVKVKVRVKVRWNVKRFREKGSGLSIKGSGFRVTGYVFSG